MLSAQAPGHPAGLLRKARPSNGCFLAISARQPISTSAVEFVADRSANRPRSPNLSRPLLASCVWPVPLLESGTDVRSHPVLLGHRSLSTTAAICACDQQGVRHLRAPWSSATRPLRARRPSLTAQQERTTSAHRK